MTRILVVDDDRSLRLAHKWAAITAPLLFVTGIFLQVRQKDHYGSEE